MGISGSGSAAYPLPESSVKRRAVRRLNLSEHVIVPWLFVASVVLVLVLDMRVRSTGYYYELLRGAWQKTAATAATAERGGECNWFEGEWVRDETYPLYESVACPFLDPGFRCAENRRPDRLYSQWRWQPGRCNLPRTWIRDRSAAVRTSLLRAYPAGDRFDSKKMLEKLRNRRLVFVGDSIGRNQWESLLCMLSTSIANKSSIYEVNGNPITKHMGFLVFKFEDYNCTVEYYRSPFLVPLVRAPAGVPKDVKTTLRLDMLDWTSNSWKSADILVFNTGHWWNYEKTLRGGCYFQEGNQVAIEMSVDDAYQIAIQTLIQWVHKEVNRSKTQVIFRTYAPAHFRGGNWRTGGTCHLETLPDLEPQISLKPWSRFLRPFRNVTSENSMTTELVFDLLNVTEMTSRRKDGHLSLYYLGPSRLSPLQKQDCSHWCLPGVPDAWNELLYALFMRLESMRHMTM